MKRSVLRTFVLATFIVSCLASCRPDNFQTEFPVKGMAILNNGAWGANNASITTYDPETKEISGNVFQTVNGKGLGDLGQSILQAGGSMYVAVNGSQLVYVVDSGFRIQKSIVCEIPGTGRLSPRQMAYGNGKVYISYYEGYLGEYDPVEGTLRTTAVGPNPEGVAFAGGKVYVANSGGYLPSFEKTVSVVDPVSFKEVSTITVNTNPALMCVNSSQSYIYVHSLGNYADIPAKVQAIRVSDGSVTDLPYSSPSGIAIDKNRLFVLCGGYDALWNPLPGTIYAHDAAANTPAGKLTETTIEKAYSISASSGYVFVGSSDYVTNGDIHIFKVDGSLVDEFDTQGLNPIQGICF